MADYQRADLEGNDASSLSEPQKPWKKIGLVVGLLIAAVIIITVSVVATNDSSSSKSKSTVKGPKNVILLIPDGTGPASITMARELMRYRNIRSSLWLDTVLVGGARTYSSDSLVTDSAASATAYACGEKTYNGAIGVDNAGLPLGTILEAAKAKGMVTGFVVTCRVTHATPASFTSHVASRGSEDDIAYQQSFLQNLDFFVGGGRDHFDPAVRSDSLDLLSHLRDRGYDVMLNRTEWDAFANAKYPTSETPRTQFSPLLPPFPVVGLFTPDDMDYEIDRWRTDQPSLSSMAKTMLSKLEAAHDITGEGGRGFLMMIEGSRVDHAAHANDPATHGYEAAQFDLAIKTALDFAANHPDTLVVSVPDHETGGLTLGRDGQYYWYPQVLAPVTCSSVVMAKLMRTSGEDWPSVFETCTTITLSVAEKARLSPLINGTSSALALEIAHIVSEHAWVSWSTTGHTGVDVPLWSFGPTDARTKLNAIHQNTDIAHVIAGYLDLDLPAITTELRKQNLASPVSTSTATLQAKRKDQYGHQV